MPKNIKILVVDDNPDILHATSRVVKSVGYQAVEATNGAECLAMIRAEAPDVILLDVVLPDADGRELAEQIKTNPQLGNPFIVLLSGKKISTEDKINGLGAGADGYIPRPVSNKELKAQIDAFVRIKKVEKTLRDSEALFRTTIYSIGDAVITTDTQGKIEYLNQEAEKLTGWDASEARNESIEEVFKIINEETRQTAESPVEKVLREGSIVGLAKPTLLVTKNGEEIAITDSAAPIKNDQGKTIGVVLVFRDETEVREAQKKLLRATQEWSATFDATKDAICLLNADQTILRCNQATAKLFGKSSEEIIGRHCWEVIHNTTEPIPDCPVLKMSTSSQRESIDLNLDQRWFTVTVDPILNQAGEFNGAVHIMRDITERVQAKEEIAHNKALLLALSRGGKAVAMAETPEAVYRAIGEQVTALDFNVTVFTLKEDQTTLQVPYLTLKSKLVRAAESLAGLSASDYTFSLEPNGVFHQIITSKKPIFRPHDATPLDEAQPKKTRSLTGRLLNLLDLQQSILTPLAVEDQVYGLLAISGSNLQESDLPAVTVFASQAAIAIEKANLMQRVIADANEMEKRVHQRTKDLQKFVNLTAGREVRMAELKKVIKKLRAQLRAAGMEPVADDPLGSEQ